MKERHPADRQKLIQDVREAVKKSLEMSSHFHSQELGQTLGDSLPDTGRSKSWQLPLSALKYASTDVEMYGSKIGGPVPEPPTVRGRIGATLVRIVRRALLWYTLQFRDFLSVLKRRHRRELDVFDRIEAALQQAEERYRNLEAAQLRVQSSQVKIDEVEAVQTQISMLSSQLADMQQAVGATQHKIESELSRFLTRASVSEVVVGEISAQLTQIRKEFNERVRDPAN